MCSKGQGGVHNCSGVSGQLLWCAIGEGPNQNLEVLNGRDARTRLAGAGNARFSWCVVVVFTHEKHDSCVWVGECTYSIFYSFRSQQSGNRSGRKSCSWGPGTSLCNPAFLSSRRRWKWYFLFFVLSWGFSRFRSFAACCLILCVVVSALFGVERRLYRLSHRDHHVFTSSIQVLPARPQITSTWSRCTAVQNVWVCTAPRLNVRVLDSILQRANSEYPARGAEWPRVHVRCSIFHGANSISGSAERNNRNWLFPRLSSQRGPIVTRGELRGRQLATAKDSTMFHLPKRVPCSA